MQKNLKMGKWQAWEEPWERKWGVRFISKWRYKRGTGRKAGESSSALLVVKVLLAFSSWGTEYQTGKHISWPGKLALVLCPLGNASSPTRGLGAFCWKEDESDWTGTLEEGSCWTWKRPGAETRRGVSGPTRWSPLSAPQRLPHAPVKPTKIETSERCGWQGKRRGQAWTRRNKRHHFICRRKAVGCFRYRVTWTKNTISVTKSAVRRENNFLFSKSDSSRSSLSKSHFI